MLPDEQEGLSDVEFHLSHSPSLELWKVLHENMTPTPVRATVPVFRIEKSMMEAYDDDQGPHLYAFLGFVRFIGPDDDDFN